MRRLAFALALAGFALPFVFFGGRVWLSLVLVSAAFAAAAAAAGAMAKGARFHRGVLVLGAVPVLVGLVQLLPLPHGLVRVLSPVRAELQAAVPWEDLDDWPAAVDRRLSLSELLAAEGLEAAPVDRPAAVPEPYALSFDPSGTLAATGALAAWLLLLAVAAGQPDERLGIGVLAGCFLLLAVGAVYGLWHARTGGPLYGIFEPPPFDHHRPYGTFWNLNHFSGLCALACPVLLATALDRGQRTAVRLGVLVLLAPVALAVLDAGSRGGLLAGGAGALLLGVALAATRGRRLLGALLCAGTIVALVLAFTLFSERLIRESFEETIAAGHASNSQRQELYARELRMIRAAPLVGNGLGAFHDAHGPYKRSQESLVPHHGESDWLETAVEAGVLAWLAWLLLLALLWAAPLRVILAGRAPPLLSGLLAGSAATIAHAAVDFHHREPAVALVSVLLAGTAQAWARGLLRGEKAPPPLRLLDRVLVPATLCLSIALILPVRDALRFDRGREGALRALEQGDPGRALEHAQEAVAAHPADGTGWALVAVARGKLAQGQRLEARRAHRREALAAGAEALRRSPATLGAARHAGAILLAVGALDDALRAARLAVAAAPGQSPSRQLLGETLLALDRPDEALAHLAFAYAGVPLARLAEQSPRFARLIREAAGAEAGPVLDALISTPHRVWYLSSLARAGRAAELPAYFALLSEEPFSAVVGQYAGVLAFAPSREAAGFAARMLPALDDSWARTLAARALVLGGREGEGRSLLEALVEREDAPPLAFLALADLELEEEERDAGLVLLREGLRRHPEDVPLARRLAAVVPDGD